MKIQNGTEMGIQRRNWSRNGNTKWNNIGIKNGTEIDEIWNRSGNTRVEQKMEIQNGTDTQHKNMEQK